MSPPFERELETLIRARYPLLYLITCEEERAVALLERVAERLRKRMLHWTVTTGWDGRRASGARDETEQALAGLEFVDQSQETGLFVISDFHPFLDGPAARPAIVRRLRELAQRLKSSYKTVILLSPVLALPPELEKEAAVLDMPLPTLAELDLQLEAICRRVAQVHHLDLELNAEQRERVLKAALGLTLNEAENVFAKSLIQTQRFDVDVIAAEKEQIIRKTGLLEFHRPSETLEGIGGLDVLKGWLRKRRRAFSEEARQFGLPAPKGILLLGVQGCGKSLTARTVSSLWHLPLLRLDVGQVFSSFIGSSEANMRRALRLAESVSPCVLWLDEIEKAFAGVSGSGSTDAGTSARVFASFLTWLQEKEHPVFVVATANEIRALPPEMIRRGRFDEIFFVDLPAESERLEIFRIHLAKRGRDPEQFELQQLAASSAGFSGAEIEQAIIAALYDAFDAGRPLSTQDLLGALREMVPLSHMMREPLRRLRRWARMRARLASSQAAEEAPASEEETGPDWLTEWLDEAGPGLAGAMDQEP